MGNLPNAKVSPRIDNGTLKWYYLDTFELQLSLELTNQDEEIVVMSPSDVVNVMFKNKSGKVVKCFEFTEIVDNTITLVFNEDCSSLFDKGEYVYDIYYIANNRTTIASNNRAVVE